MHVLYNCDLFSNTDRLREVLVLRDGVNNFVSFSLQLTLR